MCARCAGRTRRPFRTPPPRAASGSASAAVEKHHGAACHPLPPLDRFAGIDRANAERLKRGLHKIEARLDLHGMTQAEAHRALAAFIAASRDAGRRCVLVITGRGLGPERTGRPQEFGSALAAKSRSCGSTSWRSRRRSRITAVPAPLPAAAPPPLSNRSRRMVAFPAITARIPRHFTCGRLPLPSKDGVDLACQEQPMADNTDLLPYIDRLQTGPGIVHRRRDARSLRLRPSRAGLARSSDPGACGSSAK